MIDVNKIFEDLESNQTQQNEEAKQKLVDLFAQSRDAWLVHCMMEYYLSTSSPRIIEVLVRAQPPHANYIFDRLADWLKTQPNRLSALSLLSLVVRRHPTWLFKVEKHRLIKDILKLLMNERDIVPLMYALVCIIALLPIIPNLVPNFLNDLFEVFGHLASWNSHNPNHWPDDRIVHLQWGLRVLFQRLYGMFPCSFVKYLSEFVRREHNGVYHRTIKPLVETVRLHPLLVMANAESEMVSLRWKDMEPHDVIMDCANMSLSVPYRRNIGGGGSDVTTRQSHQFQLPNCDWLDVAGGGVGASGSSSGSGNHRRRRGHGHTPPFGYDLGPQRCFTSIASTSSSSTIWSPCNEINASCPIPVTPTPAHMLPLTATAPTVATVSGGGIIPGVGVGVGVGSTSAGNTDPALLAITTGSSPPEAAVEATPETTPLKDTSNSILAAALAPNRNAIRAIFPNSQPSSPLRRSNNDREQNQFNFTDLPTTVEGATLSTQTSATTVSTRVIYTQVTTGATTSYDRLLQKILHERTNSQSPFQTIEAQQAAAAGSIPPSAMMNSSSFRSPATCSNSTPDIDLDASPLPNTCLNSHNGTPQYNPTPTPTPTLLPGCKQHQFLRNMAIGSTSVFNWSQDLRRTKSCSSISYCRRYTINGASLNEDVHDLFDVVDHMPRQGIQPTQTHGLAAPPLQKSGKMLAIASATKQQTATNYTPMSAIISGETMNVASQTEERPPQYEQLLNILLTEQQQSQNISELHRNYEMSGNMPSQTLLQQYLWQCIVHRDGDGSPAYEANTVVSASGGSTATIASNSAAQLSSSSSGAAVSTATSHPALPPISRDNEAFKLLWLQLEYERYCREVHAERIRRLMGRNRHKQSLEIERDRLYEQLDEFTRINKERSDQIDELVRSKRQREQFYMENMSAAKAKHLSDAEQMDNLRRSNEDLQTKLNEELSKNKELGYDLEVRRGEIFNLAFELKDANAKAENTAIYRDKLARLEAEFVVMGEVQLKCRDRLAELDNFRARDEELRLLQDSYNAEVKELRHSLDEKGLQLDSAKCKITELQTQLQNSEKVITEQKRLIKTVKDEYEEKFKALNKKYEVLKIITMQMEEKTITMCLQQNASKPTSTAALSAHSPDTATDRTDIAWSVEHNSPLSTSLASSESLSASLRSTELRNLHALVESPNCIPESIDSTVKMASNIVVLKTLATEPSSSINVVAGTSSSTIIEGARLPPPLDLASSANTATSTASHHHFDSQQEGRGKSTTRPATSASAATTKTTTTTIADGGATLVHNFDITNNVTNTYSSH